MTPAMCLAIAIFFEARGEPIDGQYAIAQVIVNRTEASFYPDKICSVVNQKKQFSYTHDGLHDDPTRFTDHADKIAWSVAQTVANEALEGKVPFEITSTHYHNIDVDPYWTTSYEYDGKLGKHLFYTAKKL